MRKEGGGRKDIGDVTLFRGTGNNGTGLFFRLGGRMNYEEYDCVAEQESNETSLSWCGMHPVALLTLTAAA